MKPLIILTAATALLLGAGAALAKHAGGSVYDSVLELEHGRHLSKVDIQDAQSVKWDLEPDALTDAITQDCQDE